MKQAQLLLNVPFAAKDQAKSLGARWDPQQRSWYVPQGVDIQPLQAWWPKDLKEQGGDAMQQLGKPGVPPAHKPAAARTSTGTTKGTTAGAAAGPGAIFTGPPEVTPDPSDKLPWED